MGIRTALRPRTPRPHPRRIRDERGATFVLTAICMVLLMWGGAMGVDIGFTVTSTRQAQAVADTGALDVARYINLANALTSLTESNTYLSGKLANAQTDDGAANVTLSVVGGFWSNGTWSTPPNGGGCYLQIPAYNPPCTAVKVTATQHVPQIFVGGTGAVTRTSIAAITPEDGFSVGSYLPSYNSQQVGVLNDILSTVGTTATLSGTSDAALANSYVTPQQLITASGGLLTASNVLTTQLSAAQWLSTLSTALATQKAAVNCAASPVPSVCTASAALGTLTFGGSASAQLCQLVSVNGSSCSSSYLPQPGLSANLDVLQTLTTLAELGNGTTPVDVQAALGMPGVSGSTLTLTLVQPPSIVYGPTGTVGTTAQTSADLKLTVPGSGLVDIPLSTAKGTGTLTTVNCSQQDNSFSSAVITTRTTTPTAPMTLNGASISTLSIGGGANKSIQINVSQTPATASTQSAGTNPAQQGSVGPALTYTPGISSSSPLYSLLTATLPGVLGPILQAAGVAVGGTNVANLDDNCGAVSIVQ